MPEPAMQDSHRTAAPAPPADTPATPDLEAALLAIVRQTWADLHRRAPGQVSVTLDSTLDRDLGLDSLARVELLLRVEKTFGVHLPDEVLEQAETPRQLLRALGRAGRVVVPAQPLSAPAAVAGEEIAAAPDSVTTLVEALEWHARRNPERVQIIYSDDFSGNAPEIRLTYGQMLENAEKVAAGLQARGLAPRQTVTIMLPTGPEYFYAYLGILIAGGIPVPIYPPARLSQIEEHVRRHAGILANAEVVMMITIAEARPVARLLEAHVGSLKHIVTPAELMQETRPPLRVPLAASDIAFIQYTSGSTGNPKGVTLTHANLLANIRAIGAITGVTSRDVFMIWLPLYHDFGLIAAWLSSMIYGNPLVVMSPLAFLVRPERWLWAIHRHRATLTAAPNFAYELCVKRIDDSQIQGLDLSSLRVCANAAEPISPDTLERFQARFGKYGFRKEAMMPAYGLAEATVGVASVYGRGPRVDRIQRQAFARDGKAIPAAPDDPNPLRFVSCGRPLQDIELRVVDRGGRPLGERIEGQIEFRGPSATQGYYRNPEATAKLFHDDWVDTGDRGYLADGEIYLTGRVKDIIIRGGRNIYPHELEEAVGAIPGVRRGCVAVFGSADSQSGTERLVVLAETRETEADAREKLRGAVVRATVERLGEPPDEVVLAPPQTVLKTSSGKVRRAATRELYEAGLVGSPVRAVWVQVLRLVGSALWPALQRGGARMKEWLYAAYTWLLFMLAALPTWLVTALTPHPAWAWKVGRLSARLFLWLSGTRLEVRGLENLPRTGPYVLVANHASYLDGIVVVAALPGYYSFVAKQELKSQLIPRVYLDRLGTEYVERFAIRQSAEDTQRIVRAALAGRRLAFFPEGTFRSTPGLLPFRLGAFVAAARARACVVPVAIRGTRAILPDGTWRPRHGAITVTIGKPVMPPADTADSFTAAIRMRDEARAQILPHCGEPDYGQRMAA
jgi:acyl carrier protein